MSECEFIQQELDKIKDALGNEVLEIYEKIKKLEQLGDEFDRLGEMVASRYVAERIFNITHPDKESL